MKNAIIVVVILALLAPVYAAEFHLTDAAGKKYGPFEFKEGAKLSVAGQEYTISKVLTDDQKLVERMKSIIIPELNFRQADIRDVIAFLHEESVELDVKTKDARGVNMILHLPPPAAMPDEMTDPFAPGPSTVPTPVSFITFSARHISLHETLNIICKICDLEWSIKDSTVVIEPMKKDAKDPKEGNGK